MYVHYIIMARRRHISYYYNNIYYVGYVTYYNRIKKNFTDLRMYNIITKYKIYRII